MIIGAFRAIAVLLMSLSLTACTSMLWSKTGWVGFGEDLTRQVRKGGDIVKKDQLVGFVQIKSSAEHEPPQLLIVGREYVYPLTVGRDKAQQLINSGLDLKYWRAVMQGLGDDASLNLHFKNKPNDPLSFVMEVKLSYIKSDLTEQELQVLKQLDARLIRVQDAQKEVSEVYAVYLQFEGQVKGLNKQLRAIEYQKFSHDYPIVMYSPSKMVKRINYGPLLRQTALTPFTVVGDIILLPFYYGYVFLFDR